MQPGCRGGMSMFGNSNQHPYKITIVTFHSGCIIAIEKQKGRSGCSWSGDPWDITMCCWRKSCPSSELLGSAATGSLQGIPSCLCSHQAGPSGWWYLGCRQAASALLVTVSSGAVDLIPFMGAQVSLIEKTLQKIKILNELNMTAVMYCCHDYPF